jgi:hypothetical protein
MVALLDQADIGIRGRLDLARGAVDAWLHPARPSTAPGLLAIGGGAIWLIVALAIALQPVPPDWPGYLAEGLIPAAVAALLLGCAVVGAWLRGGDGGGTLAVLALDIAVAGHVAWALALLAASTGLDYGPATAVAQTVAAVGTAAVGLRLIVRGDGAVGILLVVAGTGLVIPSAWGWVVTGAAWIVVGALELRSRPDRTGPRLATA